MPAFRSGVVTEILAERRGLQRVMVGAERAYVLTQLIGPVSVGDEVVINTVAVERGLGTGGWHVVHWNLSRREWAEPGAGHIMKLRYTSLQADTGAADEDGDSGPDDLAGAPVVACTLHSQVACVAAAITHARPAARVAYVMADGAALPLALSDLVANMTASAVIVGTVTAGHAFGGELEAVSVPSALALSRHRLGADAIVVGMGPGVVGTATGLGTTAVEADGVLDVTAALGGRPILAVRASTVDPRSRHRGVSHHTLTVLRLARPGAAVPLPAGHDLVLDARDHIVEDVETPDMATVLAARGVEVTSMGRGPADDPLFFAAAGAAGVVAARGLDATR
ncbi:DUF3866 family protein [soil metagenome]